MLLLDLPSEILRQIFLLMYDDGKRPKSADKRHSMGSTPLQTFGELRLVNTTFRDFISPILFHEIDATNVKLLRLSLISESRCRGYVRHVSVGFRGYQKRGSQRKWGSQQTSAIDDYVFLSLYLYQLPNLNSINFYNEMPESIERWKEESLARDMAFALRNAPLPCLKKLSITLSVVHDFKYFVDDDCYPELDHSIEDRVSPLTHLGLFCTGEWQRYSKKPLPDAEEETYSYVCGLTKMASRLQSLSIDASESAFCLGTKVLPEAQGLLQLKLNAVHISGEAVNNMLRQSEQSLETVQFTACQLIPGEYGTWKFIFQSLVRCPRLVDLIFEEGLYFVLDDAVFPPSDDDEWRDSLESDELSNSDLHALLALTESVNERRRERGLENLQRSSHLQNYVADIN
ncbi:hypothetical protein FALCPG4_015774 [Fusarium falciforme]